jgi:hypothetical protein
VNPTLELLDQSQQSISLVQDNGAGNNDYCSRITTALSPGSYLLRVSPGDFFGTGPHSGRYILNIRAGP